MGTACSTYQAVPSTYYEASQVRLYRPSIASKLRTWFSDISSEKSRPRRSLAAIPGGSDRSFPMEKEQERKGPDAKS